MLLRRGGRLSLDQALRSSGVVWFRAGVPGSGVPCGSGPQVVTLTSPSTAPATQSGRPAAHRGDGQRSCGPGTVTHRNTSLRFITTDCKHWSLLSRPPPGSPGAPPAPVWADRWSPGGRAGGRGVFGVDPGPRSPLGPTASPQSRASSTSSTSSTARSPQKSPGEPQHNAEEHPSEGPAPPSSPKAGPGGAGPEDRPSRTQQLKKVFQEYGAVGISFHVFISLVSLGMFYLLVSSGIDMAALLCKAGFSEAVVRSKMAAGTSTFVLAYAVHKLFAPVRISATLVSVPLIVRYLRRTGLFRTPRP